MSGEDPGLQNLVNSQPQPDTGQDAQLREADESRPSGEDSDVFLDVPTLKIEELELELDDLRAHVSLRTELAGFVKVNVGVDAYLNHVKLGIKGADVQATLKVKLERILDTFNKALNTMDNNPELVLELIRQSKDMAEDLFDDSQHDVTETSGESGIANTKVEDEEDNSTATENITTGARKKAEENGLDLSSVEGSGKDGRILVRDVSRALNQQTGQ